MEVYQHIGMESVEASYRTGAASAEASLNGEAGIAVNFESTREPGHECITATCGILRQDSVEWL